MTVAALRRPLLVLVATLCVLPALAADARRYVAASFVGDKIELIGAHMQTGSHLDPNVRHEVTDLAGTFDKIVLKAVGDAIARVDRDATVSLLSVPPSRFHERPEEMLRSDGVAMPSAAVDVIERERATHVVLVTKQRGDAKFKLREGTIGEGKLRGIGYFVDNDTPLVGVESRVHGNGFIAPFVYVRLSLVDVNTGQVVREERVQATEVVPALAYEKAVTPWQALSADQKVQRLEAMIRSGIGAAIETLLAGR
jgi:hypothetical protein